MNAATSGVLKLFLLLAGTLFLSVRKDALAMTKINIEKCLTLVYAVVSIMTEQPSPVAKVVVLARD